MVEFYAKLLVDDLAANAKPSTFWDYEVLFFNPHRQEAEAVLSALSFKVIRKPRDLLAHWQRIYFCYQQALSEPLYAALLDLLIILNNKGKLFSQRMIHGSRSQLDSAQLSKLSQTSLNLLTVIGNRYSLFTTGLIGKSELLVTTQFEQEQHDYLALAEDFIEYSQIEEAMKILELGLTRNPARQDLQALLLEIYQMTRDSERFKLQYQSIRATGVPLIDEWQLLADSFEGKTS
jgi:hypothetical protein